MTPEELVGIFQRITRDQQTSRDIETLRDVLIWTGSQHVVQSGSGNINIGQGRDIQILNYTFSEQQTEIIRQFLEKFKETSPHNLPRSGVRQFVGRDEALKNLDEQLQESKRVAISTLTGMGGIGKTELALQYALADRDREPEKRKYQAGMCWINVSEKGNVGDQILSFAEEYLEIPILEEGELEDRVRHCWQHWQKGETLIIFDDVREYSQIKDFLPPQEKRFKVIITTRKQRLAESIKVLAVEVLEEQPALDLIISFIGEERVNSQIEEAKGLCKNLGYLPLGLELVARFLNRRQNWSIEKMRGRLKEEELAAKPITEASEEMTAERGVKAAFEVSWQELSGEAKTLACYLSLFATVPISYPFIQAVSPIEDEDDLEEILEDSLINLSLVKPLGDQWYEIHTLIHQYLRDKLEKSELATEVKESYCKLMTGIAQKIPETPTQSDIQNFTPAIPHLAVAARDLNRWIEDGDLIWVYTGLGRFYEGQGLYKEAEPWYKQCLSVARERLGDDHPDVATSLNNLAALYYSQGRYQEAEPLLIEALSLSKRLLGDDHPDVATSLNNLAGLYDSQGRYQEAESLYLEALSLSKRLLGDDHPSVATSLNNLAYLYDSQGRYQEAEPLYQQAIAIATNTLGENHPNTQTIIRNYQQMISKEQQSE